MLLNQFQKSLIQQKITRMISNFKYHCKVKTMLFIQELYSWDLHQVNLQELYSILDLSTWLLHPFFATTKQLETTNSKSTTHYQEDLFQETKCIKDVKLWHTTCTNLTQTKFYLKLLQSSHTDLLSFRDSFGKITPASSPSRELIQMQFNLNQNLNQINVPSSNSQPCTNHKVLVMTQMEFQDFLPIRT